MREPDLNNNLQLARGLEGYIVDPDDWNEALAEQLSAEENLQLTRDYWPVLLTIPFGAGMLYNVVKLKPIAC